MIGKQYKNYDYLMKKMECWIHLGIINKQKQFEEVREQWGQRVLVKRVCRQSRCLLTNLKEKRMITGQFKFLVGSNSIKNLFGFLVSLSLKKVLVTIINGFTYKSKTYECFRYLKTLYREESSKLKIIMICKISILLKKLLLANLKKTMKLIKIKTQCLPKCN
jgi:hypothetical protein